jgi:uncharacterized protein (DUF305 family)
MVDKFINVYPNLNQLYMAGAMTMPMILIELFFMRAMYTNRNANFIISAASILLLGLCILFVRQQTAITDKEFLKSMIPHHGAAILMCEKSSIQDSEIKELCKNILLTQQAEINFMKEKLAALQ